LYEIDPFVETVEPYVWPEEYHRLYGLIYIKSKPSDIANACNIKDLYHSSHYFSK